ncbi:MAG: hypothetical protein SP4CHLAM5_00160 [Chlamydiia bacterium]|nr:hypothetical protein [Chlamydiia bacterium]MCH9617895.1 hypothetical protein [Chlamydiia bacterium]MCH9624111.1 hypothetical protein [Chlamydiia bacterium]
MNDKALSTEIFQNKDFSEQDHILVVGYNSSLVHTLPKGTVTIDSSISKIRNAHSQHQDKTFQTHDLASFALEKNFTNIYSMGTLHLEKDLTNILIHIHKHLTEEALLYFPLSSTPLIETALAEDPWKESTQNAPFQKRTRADIEEAVLAAPFESILIEEMIENLAFYSKQSLKTHLLQQLTHLTTLQGPEKVLCAQELTEKIYEGQNPDQVCTLKTPWILLTLSNDKNIL